MADTAAPTRSAALDVAQDRVRDLEQRVESLLTERAELRGKLADAVSIPRPLPKADRFKLGTLLEEGE